MDCGANRPDVAPSEIKSLTWTWLPVALKDTLPIHFPGRNHVSGEYADRAVDFVRCEQDYGELADLTGVVGFARGRNSATVPLSFVDAGSRIVFALGMSRGKKVQIDSESCRISVLLSSGQAVECVEWESGDENTFASVPIDRMTIESTPQNGKYLGVLQPMTDDARPGSVTFRITSEGGEAGP